MYSVRTVYGTFGINWLVSCVIGDQFVFWSWYNLAFGVGRI